MTADPEIEPPEGGHDDATNAADVAGTGDKPKVTEAYLAYLRQLDWS